MTSSSEFHHNLHFFPCFYFTPPPLVQLRFLLSLVLILTVHNRLLPQLIPATPPSSSCPAGNETADKSKGLEVRLHLICRVCDLRSDINNSLQRRSRIWVEAICWALRSGWCNLPIVVQQRRSTLLLLRIFHCQNPCLPHWMRTLHRCSFHLVILKLLQGIRASSKQSPRLLSSAPTVQKAKTLCSNTFEYL